MLLTSWISHQKQSLRFQLLQIQPICSFFLPKAQLDHTPDQKPARKSNICRALWFNQYPWPGSPRTLRNRYESDMKTSAPDDGWEWEIKRVYSSSVCLRHTVAPFGVKWPITSTTPQRDCLTSLQRLNMWQVGTPRRKRREKSSLRKLWSCPKSTQFWKPILDASAKVLPSRLNPSPQHLLALTTPLARRLFNGGRLHQLLMWAGLNRLCSCSN